jgi:galactoside O-acetyltransferase
MTEKERKAFHSFLEGDLTMKTKLLLLPSVVRSIFEFIVNFMPGIGGYGLRQLYYSKRFSRIGRNVLFGEGIIIIGDPKRVEIGDFCWLDSYCRIEVPSGFLRLGDRVHVGPGTILGGEGGLEIGSFTGIAAGCKIYSSSLVPDNGKLMTPMVQASQKSAKIAPVSIGRRCFLGVNSTVLPGTTIGDDAIVGAHTLVTSDIPAKSVAVGAPARVIRVRNL